MTFGDCFKPSVATLATCWNQLESNRLKKTNEGIFWLQIKGEWSFIRQFSFFLKWLILATSVRWLEEFGLLTNFPRGNLGCLSLNHGNFKPREDLTL
jgi:hypothetical protein